ncbi:hypothetical protein KM043_000260 [Ampulex compressa]|nr:hypothetical protein KM043_000260 [Ampulex compressa]
MKYIQKSQLYLLLHPWFNTGLLTSDGAKWQERRKILTPAFHFNVLQTYVDIFIEEGGRMVESLRAMGGPVIKDLLYFSSEHTLNAICETAMGTSLQGRGVFQEKYRTAVRAYGQCLAYRLVRPWLHTTLTFALTAVGRSHDTNLSILHNFSKKIIEERKEYHEQTGGRYLKSFAAGSAGTEETQEDKVTGIRKKRLAMLDLLIAAQWEKKIDDQGIREEVDTFIFEGHDTTAMAICYTLMLLAEHRDAQDRARMEVDELLRGNGGKFSMALLQRMPYLERCIKESLRLYPPVHFISREITEDMQLKKYFIPRGTICNIHIYEIHRDSNFWPNPDAFDPDRFLPENILGRHPYSYVPFSAGPRNCIGQRFAMMELKAMVGHLLHHFILEPVDYLKDLRIIADLVIRPAHPIRIKFVPVE